jgi:phage head maturation protease
VKTKSAPAQLSPATTDTGTSGEFEAIVSVFGNVDSWGDVVRPGAFADSITAWKSSPNTLPVLWSHRMDDPTYNIGEILDIAELESGRQLPDWVDPHLMQHGGLWVKGRIDTGEDASPIARQALRLMKARRVTQFSYAYDEIESGWATADGRDVWELRKLKLYEVSPCQIGANELTELLAAKTGLKVGRTLSKTNEGRIQQASDLLAEVLQSIGDSDSGESGDDDTEKSKPVASAVARLSPESVRLIRETTRKAIALRASD